MPIKIKLGQLVAAVEAKVIERIESGKPPWAVRFACARFCAAVLEEYGRYAKIRDELVRQYGLLDQTKGIITVSHPNNSPENVKAFYDGLNEVLASEAEIACEPLSTTRLGEESPLTIGDIRLLGPLVVE